MAVGEDGIGFENAGKGEYQYGSKRPVNIPVSIPEMSIPVSDRDRYNMSLSLKQALWSQGKGESGERGSQKRNRHDACGVGRPVIRD